MGIKNASFAAKLTAAQSALTAILFLVGGFSVYTIVALRTALTEMADTHAARSELISELETRVSQLSGAQKAMMLSGMTADAAGVGAAKTTMNDGLTRSRKLLEQLAAIEAPAELRQMENEIRESVEQWGRLTPQLISALESQRFDEAARMQTESFKPLSDKVSSQARRAVEAQRKETDASAQGADTRSQFAQWIAILMCVAAVVAAGFSFLTVRGGNSDLRLISKEIAEGAQQVASAATQVSAASQSMAQGSSEQAASLEETSASTEEINSMTQKNAESARTAASEVQNVDKMLKETNVKLDEMIQSMREINASSEKIGRIIKVIDEIAFQTNILALNAAVEAARAGEAGMGFAVVADEVRNLAQRSAQAARDTSELIEESIVRSNEGKAKLDGVAEWVSKVVENAARINLLANEVHLGSQEQARGIDQIARAVAQMQAVTQSTAASAEESASAGEMMSTQASKLNHAVDRLRKLVGSDENSEQARPAVTVLAKAKHSASGWPGAGKPARTEAPGRGKSKAADPFPMDGDFQDF